MEFLLYLAAVALFIIGFPFVSVILLFGRVRELENKVERLEGKTAPAPLETAPAEIPAAAPQTRTAPPANPPPAQPPLMDVISAREEPSPVMESAVRQDLPAPETPASFSEAAQPEPELPQEETEPLVNWSNFTAAKLFSWIGGFMLFLGCVFCIKYSVENNLLSPALRIWLSAALGAGLAAAGVCLNKPELRVTAHTLLGSGMAVLYAAIYSAHAFYQLIPLSAAFALMAATAFASFGAAVWKNAKYVGYLGTVIAFLTPVLLSSGQDAWIFFFSYILLINAAAAASALKRGWSGLIICSLAFTWLCQAFWLGGPADLQTYKLNGVCVFFTLYALGAAAMAAFYKERLNSPAKKTLGAFLCAGLLLTVAPAAADALNLAASLKLLGYALWVNLLLAWLGGKDGAYAPFAIAGKTLSFLTLLVWTNCAFTATPLAVTFTLYLLFAAVNGGTELWLARRGENKTPPGFFTLLYPALLMLPLLWVFSQNAELGFGAACAVLGLFFVLLAAAILLALLAGQLAVALAGAGLTLLALLILAGRAYVWTEVELSGLLLLGLVPVLLCAVIFGAYKTLKKTESALPGEKILSFFTALTPFILMLAAVGAARDAAQDVHLIMGFTLALSAVAALCARIYKDGAALPAALAGATLVQWAYCANFLLGKNGAPVTAFSFWTLGIFALFALFPFVFKKRFLDSKTAWAAAALAGLPACLLIYRAVSSNYDFPNPGLLPLAFAFVYMAACSWTYGWQPVAEGIQRTRLAFLGGVTLLFITLVFPLQLSGRWLTLAWALEGAALIALNRFLDHKGLTRTGFALLGLVFLRLLLAPGLESPLAHIKLLNWYLGVFGLSGAAMIAAAKWWRPQEETSWKNALSIMGGVTLFILVNIEIAHWFSYPGHLSFELFGSVAAAVTYTLAWALFGGACLALGLHGKTGGLTKTGIALMAAALAKFFLSDIWSLDALYRIFGLFGLAVILIGASFWYQKNKQKNEP